MMNTNDLKLYIVTADYRLINNVRPRYKCAARNKTECRKKFKEIFSWLKIYSVEEIDGVIDRNTLIL